ncbi:MAG TPA: hypothetical protein VJW55_14790, partial [Candidatus Angelobacter sp.]|nr:hypothetical protein [Candidatus Angelobacter sp.]
LLVLFYRKGFAEKGFTQGLAEKSFVRKASHRRRLSLIFILFLASSTRMLKIAKIDLFARLHVQQRFNSHFWQFRRFWQFFASGFS